MNKLVVYFSNTGNNKYIAEKLGMDLPADVVELDAGKFSMIGIMWAILWKSKSKIEPLEIDWNKYDELYVCGPVWAGMLSSPVRYFLDKYADKIEKVNLFFTCGSDEGGMVRKIISEVENLLGRKPNKVSFLALSEFLSEGIDKDPKNVMKMHLDDKNFVGKVKERYVELLKG